MITPAHAASRPSRTGGQAFPDHARREIFRRTRSMVFDSVPRCGEEHTVRAITSPVLRRDDVQAAFDEISEKVHLTGIELTFAEHHSGNLQAIFAPADLAAEPLQGAEQTQFASTHA